MDNIKEKYDSIVNELSDFRGFLEDNDNFSITRMYDEILSNVYELKEMMDYKIQDVIYIDIEDMEAREFSKIFKKKSDINERD